MKKVAHLFALLFAFVFLFSACEEKEDPTPATKTEMLTSGTWKVNKVLANNTDHTDNNGMRRYASSEVLYRTDGTYVWKHVEGTYSGDWEFGDNETVLWEDKDTTDEIKWNIKEIKPSSFIITTNRVDANGTAYLLELQWVKK